MNVQTHTNYRLESPRRVTVSDQTGVSDGSGHSAHVVTKYTFVSRELETFVRE